jgi:hypothetical protein
VSRIMSAVSPRSKSREREFEIMGGNLLIAGRIASSLR